MTNEQLPKTAPAPGAIENLETCRRLLVEAGQIALRYFRTDLVADNKLQDGGYDPVTRADQEVEAFLRRRLREQYPTFGVIGEEEGETAGSSADSWIIDPIDGTKAFISGLPTWGLLLGHLRGRQAVAGMMYQPFTEEFYVGSAAGAFLYHAGLQHRLATRSAATLEDAVLYCTHENMFVDRDHLAAFRRVAERVRLQRFGGDCYAYCMLALGRVDLIVEDTLQPYDIIPLIPIIEAAGGVVTDSQGNSALDGGFVIAAANGTLHNQALELIQKA